MSIDNRLSFERTDHNTVTFVIRRLRVGNLIVLNCYILQKKKEAEKTI